MDKDIRMTIAITGHRPKSLDNDYTYLSDTWKFIYSELANTFEKIQPKAIITGMALGVDTVAAEVALANSIPYIAAVPFVGQESRWTSVQKERYQFLLAHAERVHVVNEEGYYAPKIFQDRNEWMVDNADIVVAVWNGVKGGTRNCIEYALRSQVPVWRIDPRTRKVGRYDGSKIIQKQALPA